MKILSQGPIIKLYLAFLLIIAVISLVVIKPKLEKSEPSLVPIIKPAVQILAKTEIEIKPLTLENIFSENHDWTLDLDQEKVQTLIATGDVMLGRTVNFNASTKYGFNWPFENVKYILSEADIAFINLEGPLTNSCKLRNTGMIFCGDIKNIEGLTFAGIDIANIANNHSFNYSKKGLQTTIDLLTQNGIQTSGIGKPTYKDIDGTKFAFIGFNNIEREQPGVSWASEANIKAQIKEAKDAQSDVVIVQFHWGVEYKALPSTRQKMLAHLAIDSGADLIIGNHPHWIQPIEIYKGKLITYSHGNLIFDQMWSKKTREGVIGRYTFYENQLVDVEFIPIFIEDFGQPRLMEPDEGKLIIDEMKKNSEILMSSKDN